MMSENDEPDERPAARIILVEPKPIDATIFRVLLERAGSRVDVEGDSGAALGRLRGELLYDLVILGLPGGGVAMISAIRALPGLRGRVPIVALGASADLADVRGVDRLDKPLRPRLLVERVRYRLAAADPRVADKPVLDRAAFATWCRRIPANRVGVALDLFQGQLQRASTAFADSACSRETASAVSHGLIASAGTLGFTQLYEASLSMQAICHAKLSEDWHGPLAVLRSAIDAAALRFAHLIAEQSATAMP